MNILALQKPYLSRPSWHTSQTFIDYSIRSRIQKNTVLQFFFQGHEDWNKYDLTPQKLKEALQSAASSDPILGRGTTE